MWLILNVPQKFPSRYLFLWNYIRVIKPTTAEFSHLDRVFFLCVAALWQRDNYFVIHLEDMGYNIASKSFILRYVTNFERRKFFFIFLMHSILYSFCVKMRTCSFALQHPSRHVTSLIYPKQTHFFSSCFWSVSFCYFASGILIMPKGKIKKEKARFWYTRVRLWNYLKVSGELKKACVSLALWFYLD